MDINLIWITLAAFLGTMGSAVAGWLDSKEPFNPRQFMSSVYRGLVAVIASDLISHYTSAPLTIAALFYAFTTGAAFDVLGNRLAGATTPTPPVTPTPTPTPLSPSRTPPVRPPAGTAGT